MRVTDLPDLSDWQKVEVWTVDEAALLWSAIDPDSLRNTHVNFNQSLLDQLFDSVDPVRERKAKIYRRAIIEAICGGTLPFARAIELHDDYQNGEWGKEVLFPDLPDPEKMISSRTRVQQAAFIKWAKSKNIPSYREQVTRADALAKKPEIKAIEMAAIAVQPLALAAPAYLDPDNPLSPAELRAAHNAWNAITENGSHEVVGMSAKEAVLKFLNENQEYKLLSREARLRIATLTNWNKKGGAPKTPG